MGRRNGSDLKKRHRALALPVILLTLLAVAVAGGFWLHYALVQRWKWEPIVMPERLARVTEPWPVATLAQRLQKTKKIRDLDTFIAAAQQVHLTQVAPGAYPLPAKAGPLDLATIFKAPPALIKVTFPEGWTALQMAARMDKAGITGADAFAQLVYPSSQPVSPWEGRLFPDTYYLPRLGTGKDLVHRLNDRYSEVFACLHHPFPMLDGKPMTGRQVTTLASLVERETDVPEERPLIAGVLLHRLQIHMALQCDATVQYAIERAASGTPGAVAHKTRLLFRDLKIPSPYNTYLNKGLPPGPICNPGAESLAAAAAPQTTPYLFYVMSPSLGRHRFAATFAEHEHNIRLAKTERLRQ